ADEGMGSDVSDDVEQRDLTVALGELGNRRPRTDELHLEVDQTFEAIVQEPVTIDEPTPLPSLRRWQPGRDERTNDLVGDTDTRGACADDHHSQIGERCAADPHPTDDRSDADRSGPLDVVVERTDPISVR